jgi:hypothetical protein
MSGRDEGPRPGESPVAWGEGIEPPGATPPQDYQPETGGLGGCLLGLLVLAIIVFAMVAIGVSGGFETIGQIQ